MKHVVKVVGAFVILALLAASCGGGSQQGSEEPKNRALTVYSGRDQEFIGPLLDSFEDQTGIRLEIRYGDTAELAATILEEGSSSPADVFISQDAGALGAVADAGLLAPIDQEIVYGVDERFRSPDALWVGISGRARVAAYNTESLDEGDLPASIEEFTDPAWRGRIGFPPTNASFQAFVAAMLLTRGEREAREFLEGLVANEPKLFEDNSSTVRAVAAGEIDVGFVNHYYKYEVEAEEGPIPVENHFFGAGDPGALVNAAGVGILGSSDDPEGGARLVDFLTGPEGQRYFAEETFEYPVVPGFEPHVDLLPLEEIEAPDIDLSDLGGTIEPALRLLAEVGLL